jgi:hypothetical protein
MNAWLFNERIRTYAATRKLCYDDAVFEIEYEQCRRELAKKSGSADHKPKRVKCRCAESIVNGRRIPVHRQSDCEYVARRSALVPEASRLATEKVGDPLGDADCGYRWSAEVVRVMNRLSGPLLRQSGNGSGANGMASKTSK